MTQQPSGSFSAQIFGSGFGDDSADLQIVDATYTYQWISDSEIEVFDLGVPACGDYEVIIDPVYVDEPLFLDEEQPPALDTEVYICTGASTSCTPTIALIQVNSSQTNTVILGTSGVLNITGTCLDNATSVTINGTGVTITGFVQNGSSQVTALYQSTTSGSPTLGNETVTIQTPNGSPYRAIFAITVTLKSFSFTNSTLYSRDCAGAALPIASPTWPVPTTDSDLNPLVCPQRLGYTGDHAVYYAGQTMAGTAVFTVNPATLVDVPGIAVQGATSGVGNFSATATIPSGLTSFSAAVSDSTHLPVQTQFYNPLNISWSVGETGLACSAGPCVTVGTSSNPLYVTLAPHVMPPTLPGGAANPVMLTYVALAVGSGGATDQPSALATTWAQFSTGSDPADAPANVKTWDNRAMFYYSAGSFSCALNAVGIVQTNGSPVNNSSAGQCGAFAWLLESVLAMNGIHSNWTTVTPSDGTLMVIKNWTFASPTLTSPAPWIYNFHLNGGPSSGIDYMLPTLASYGDLTNCTGVSGGCNGLPGQGVLYPLEKVFNRHFIVRVCINSSNSMCTASGNQYYDPSYGVTYPSETGFESQAVAGYAAQFGSEIGTGNYQFRAAIAPPLAPNISFSWVSGNSM